MNIKKYSFSIENVEMIEENPNSNFAVLSLDFFASGKNLHDTWVSEDTLIRTADTIKKCPLVWKYDEVLDDVYTHDDEEVPCGFVPEKSTIKAKKLSDGRTMLSTNAYVWKRYTGPLLDIFKRDGGKKPVSVEISVYAIKPMDNGLVELVDYRFEGITILGSYVRPAIPNALATVVSFEKEKEEYKKALEEEISSKIKLSKEFIEEITIDGEDETIVTFPYKKKGDINPALKGISPPVSVGQANEIARQADSIGVDKNKNGWAIAISNFKKTHKVVDGKWIRKNKKMSEDDSEELGNNKKEISMNKINEDLEKDKEEFEEKLPKEEKPEKETPKEKEEKGKENKEEKDKKMPFEYPDSFNMEEMSSLFAEDEEEEEIKMAKKELEKKEYASPQILMSGMFAKMKKMAKAIKEMAKKNKVYMEENEKLKEFKSKVEAKNKEIEIMATIEEIEKKVIVPEEAKEEMIKEAENYSIENIDEWKTECKAKSFDFAIRSDKNVTKVGMPHSEENDEEEEYNDGFDLWADEKN